MTALVILGAIVAGLGLGGIVHSDTEGHHLRFYVIFLFGLMIALVASGEV